MQNGRKERLEDSLEWTISDITVAETALSIEERYWRELEERGHAPDCLLIRAAEIE